MFRLRSVGKALLLLSGLCAVVVSGCATGSQRPLQVSFDPSESGQPTLAEVAKAYHEGCICGDKNTFKEHNCTHYLSNAFIEAGYTELLTSPLFTVRCSEGRPVRAQELMKWFQLKSKQFHSGRVKPDTGYWASYQEKPGWRHVTLLDSGTGKFYGTADCPKWPVQWNYQW
ncbi:MAG: hypothetical protein AMXMBFR82_21930 [Candidatus Hydrogenedentota bacterium]